VVGAPSILVVDDVESNRKLARFHLAAAGYDVKLAATGAEALALVAAVPPDLILLDIGMPDMDGIECCRRVRALRGGEDIAIVFLTSHTDSSTHEAALASGGDDYLTKPIQKTELLIRVRSLLRIAHMSRELRAAERQKEELTEFLVHDLKNPLSSILANAHYLGNEAGLGEEARAALADLLIAGQSMSRMVQGLLDVRRSENVGLAPAAAPVDVGELVAAATAALAAPASDRRLRFAIDVPALAAAVDRELTLRVLDTLIDNCVRHAPAGSAIAVAARAQGEVVELRVADEGPEVPEEQRERIFDKLALLERNDGLRTGRGLGLHFCRLAVDAQGGRIWVEPNQPRGTVFCLRLPRAG
jgi:two-component system, sensor histidine kinase and response regulator